MSYKTPTCASKILWYLPGTFKFLFNFLLCVCSRVGNVWFGERGGGVGKKWQRQRDRHMASGGGRDPRKAPCIGEWGEEALVE